ncbi:MAG: J domain-containing protein [Alphaproteobacteria bacterium]|nr:J domain-containing protein [Alphaproteobacteria bacterium]
MNLDSKYFDMIRISRDDKKSKGAVGEAQQICDWEGCRKHGPHPAPAAPHLQAAGENNKRHFCSDHIASYNKSFDFFEGMDADDVDKYRRAAITGHRPTWNLGSRRAHEARATQYEDPLELLKGRGAQSKGSETLTPQTSAGQRRALDTLHLTPEAKAADIRKQYKVLVKKYHPDTNGGNRDYEERFQRTVQAYQYLRASGFC